MVIPKQVIIAGKAWTVKKDKNETGGSFRSSTHTITVGTKNDKQDQIEVFLHEVLEAVLSNRYMRYALPYDEQTNGDLIFVFTHGQFDLAIADLALALKDCLK